MKLASIVLWAVIVRSQRSEWIHYPSLRHRRKDVWEAFCDGWLSESRPALEMALKIGKYRLARVVVREVTDEGAR